MNKRGQASTKAELIAAYGEEWYEDFKAKCRKYQKERYDADPEGVKAKNRARRAKNPVGDRRYSKAHNAVYRISSRDRGRLLRRIDLTGLEIHHFKYHADNNDPAWIDDMVLLTPEEHRKWHAEHPEFVAMDNIV
jgi:hypothetical protein